MLKTPIMENYPRTKLNLNVSSFWPKKFFRQRYSNVSKTKIPKITQYHFQRPVYSNSNVSKIKIPKITKWNFQRSVYSKTNFFLTQICKCSSVFGTY